MGKGRWGALDASHFAGESVPQVAQYDQQDSGWLDSHAARAARWKWAGADHRVSIVRSITVPTVAGDSRQYTNYGQPMGAAASEPTSGL